MSKKTARIICHNESTFWTTQKRFWRWVKEGRILILSHNPLTGRLEGEPPGPFRNPQFSPARLSELKGNHDESAGFAWQAMKAKGRKVGQRAIRLIKKSKGA